MGTTARTAIAVTAIALLGACQQGPDIGEADLDLRQWTEADDPAASTALPDGRNLWITAESVTIIEDVDVALHPSPDGGQQVVVTSPMATLVPEEFAFTDDDHSELGIIISRLSRDAEDPDIDFVEPPSRYALSVGANEATPVAVVSADIEMVCIEVMWGIPAHYPTAEGPAVPSGLAIWTDVGRSGRVVELACGGRNSDAPVRDNYDWAAEQIGTEAFELSTDFIYVDASRDPEEGWVSLSILPSSPVEIQVPTDGTTLAGVAGTGIWYWDPEAERLPVEDWLALEIPIKEDSPLWWDHRDREICLAVYPAGSDEPTMHCTELD